MMVELIRHKSESFWVVSVLGVELGFRLGPLGFLSSRSPCCHLFTPLSHMVPHTDKAFLFKVGSIITPERAEHHTDNGCRVSHCRLVAIGLTIFIHSFYRSPLFSVPFLTLLLLTYCNTFIESTLPREYLMCGRVVI